MKTSNLLIRVDSALKESIEKRAKELGLSASAYLRMIAIKEINDSKKNTNE